MPRIDITRLRKEHGLSQNELAQKLQITQSFLSAIENGKSPLPPEKEDRLLEIFSLDSLDDFLFSPNRPSPATNSDIAEMTDSDLFNQLLSRFHKQAHSNEDHHHHQEHHDRIEALEHHNEILLNHNESLLKRNDRLDSLNESLRSEIYTLRNEIFRLKSILLKNNIQEF